MAGFYNWTNPDDVTPAKLNSYLRDQVTTICTAATKPTTTQVGLQIAVTDTRNIEIWNGSAYEVIARWGAWDAYTPTVTQGATVTHSSSCTWTRSGGRLVHVDFSIGITGTGTAGQQINVTLPTAAVAAGQGFVGQVFYFDGSSGLGYILSTRLVGAGLQVQFQENGNSFYTNTLGAGDLFYGTISYRTQS